MNDDQTVYVKILFDYFLINDYIYISGRKTYLKKRRWTNEEITDAKMYFSKCLCKGKLLSLSEIEKVKVTHDVLSDRKPDVIKTWLHNQLKKNKTFE